MPNLKFDNKTGSLYDCGLPYQDLPEDCQHNSLFRIRAGTDPSIRLYPSYTSSKDIARLFWNIGCAID